MAVEQLFLSAAVPVKDAAYGEYEKLDGFPAIFHIPLLSKYENAEEYFNCIGQWQTQILETMHFVTFKLKKDTFLQH